MNEKITEIHIKLLKPWLENDKKGIIIARTGIGKTKIALDACKHFDLNAKILFLAEATDRKKDLDVDIKKFDCKHNITFMTYQSAYKLKDTNWDLVIADEIHDSLTPVYSKFYFNNNYTSILGLTATLDGTTKYDIGDDKIITKEDIMNNIGLSIVTKYTIDDSIDDNVSRELMFFIIYHDLDDKNKYIESGSKTKTFYQTEKKAYEYYDKEMKKAFFSNNPKIKSFLINNSARKKASILWKLKSKKEPILKLLKHLKGKTLIFGNDIKTLLEITPNVVSSYNSDEANNNIRDKFDNNKLKVIGSFKKLKQGANLKMLDNIILHSYYSKEKDLIQRIGRLRFSENVGKVFIIITLNTQEKKWFEEMTKDINNISMLSFHSVENLIQWMNTKYYSSITKNKD